jgi:hypothetical protein
MDATHMTATDIVLIITALATAICSIIAAVKSTSAANDAKSATDSTQATHAAVNGRMSEMIASAKAEAFAAGHSAGFAEALPLQVAPVDRPPVVEA